MSLVEGLEHLCNEKEILQIVTNVSECKVDLVEIPDWHLIETKSELENWVSKSDKDVEGMFLVKDFSEEKKGEVRWSLIYDLKKHLEQKKNHAKNCQSKSTSLALQKFRPDLYLHQGCRMDLRCYVLLLSVDPLTVIFSKGYCKRSCVPFDLSKRLHRAAYSTSFKDQVLHPEFESIKKSLFFTELDSLLVDSGVDQFKFWNSIQFTCMKIIKAWHSQLKLKRIGTFSVLNFDFLLPKDLKNKPIMAGISINNSFSPLSQAFSKPQSTEGSMGRFINHLTEQAVGELYRLNTGSLYGKTLVCTCCTSLLFE